jgi:hypothetical protein
MFSDKERDVCQTCGKPGMTLRHRQRCLHKSEKAIMKQLKKNKKMEEQGK